MSARSKFTSPAVDRSSARGRDFRFVLHDSNPWYTFFMVDTSRIRKSLKASHVVKIWFWDGVREYLGEAVELSAERATALLKMSQFGNSTVIPTRKLMEGLIKHLTHT